MRLVFIYHDRLNYLGGPIVNARRLLPELVRRGHDVHCIVFYSGYAASNVPFLRESGVTCHVRPLRDDTSRHVLWILKLVSRLQPDAFIPNLSVSGCFAAKWIRDAGIPTIAVLRSEDTFYRALAEQFVHGHHEWSVTGVVCVSDELARDAYAGGRGPGDVCVIPSGVPMPETLSDQTGAVRLVYLGRLVQEQKRIRDLVEALAAVANAEPTISAMLIGDGPDREILESRIRALGLSKRIVLRGGIPEKDLHRLLTGFQVLVLLSDYEGTPGAVIDGMACGLVPVCLDIPGGVQELVIHEQTGLLVRDRDADFVTAVCRLVADTPFRMRLAGAARAHVEAHFSLDIAADRWEHFLAKQISAMRGTRKPIAIPDAVQLPTVLPGLAREDLRGMSPATRLVFTGVRAAKQLLSSVGLLPS